MKRFALGHHTIHVFRLPAAVTLLMYVHFRLIRQHGISEPM